MALGTTSERNSKSSDESARDFRLPLESVVFGREKRFRKRDTTDGAGAGGSGSGNAATTVVDAGLDGCEDDATAADAMEGNVAAEEIVLVFGGLALSRLGRGEPNLTSGLFDVCTGDVVRSTFSSATDIGIVCAFRDQNDNKPLAFLPLLMSELLEDVCSSSFSTTRQPTGSRSSCTIAGLDFTSASQAVDPFEAKKWAIGLIFVNATFLVSRMASAMFFAVAVLPNWAGGGNVMSSGGRNLSMAIDLSSRNTANQCLVHDNNVEYLYIHSQALDAFHATSPVRHPFLFGRVFLAIRFVIWPNIKCQLVKLTKDSG